MPISPAPLNLLSQSTVARCPRLHSHSPALPPSLPILTVRAKELKKYRSIYRSIPKIAIKTGGHAKLSIGTVAASCIADMLRSITQ